MHAGWTQALSLTGAVLILIAYGAVQLGRMDPRGLAAGVLNLVGSLLVAASALAPANAGVLLLEGSWALISVGTLVALARRADRPAPAAGPH